MESEALYRYLTWTLSLFNPLQDCGAPQLSCLLGACVRSQLDGLTGAEHTSWTEAVKGIVKAAVLLLSLPADLPELHFG